DLLVERDRDVTGGHGGVDVNEHAPLVARPHDLGDGLECADFVVAPLQVHEGGVGTHGGEQLVRVDTAAAVDTDLGDVVAGRCFAHGRVLDGGEHDVVAALRRHPRCGYARLGRSAGEHDLSRPCTEQRCDLLARDLD